MSSGIAATRERRSRTRFRNQCQIQDSDDVDTVNREVTELVPDHGEIPFEDLVFV